MKLVITMIILVAALALATTAEAKPTKTTQINATLVGTGCGVTGLECGEGGGAPVSASARSGTLLAARTSHPRSARLPSLAFTRTATSARTSAMISHAWSRSPTSAR
jgi:hypothetical protein